MEVLDVTDFEERRGRISDPPICALNSRLVFVIILCDITQFINNQAAARAATHVLVLPQVNHSLTPSKQTTALYTLHTTHCILHTTHYILHGSLLLSLLQAQEGCGS